MDRIVTPSGVFTMPRPFAGLYEDMEDEDNQRGPEPEPDPPGYRVIIRRPLTGRVPALGEVR